MTAFEKRRGQADEMAEHIAHHLPRQLRAEGGDGIAARRLHHRPQHGQPAKGDGQRDQQPAVARGKRRVHHDLEQKRRDKHGQQQRDRQGKNLRGCGRSADNARPQIGQAWPDAVALRFEVGRGRELQRHAGEVVRHLGQRHDAQANAGIVDFRPPAPHTFEHDEMVEIPVQDGGRLQPVQLLQIDPQRPSGELQLARDLDDLLQRCPARAQQKARAQTVEVGVVAVKARDHGQAGEAALRHLGLQDNGQPSHAASSIRSDREHPARTG